MSRIMIVILIYYHKYINLRSCWLKSVAISSVPHAIHSSYACFVLIITLRNFFR
jgi:hypothetical protein